jgi:hypothetical protein
MAVLNSTQRNTLEKAVLVARRAAEQGATNALQAFAVHHHEPYGHMTMEDRALRNHLRSKARLLGDKTTSDGGHTIAKLAYELAYEYWHRMLFAKFLEANDLLIHPVHEMAISLEECEELGKEEGYEDKWVAAAYYASKMLPAIFRQDDPLLQIKYATEDRVKLEQLIEGLEEEIFTADDSLGWVYQYWQSDEKQRVNDAGDKIDGESLPAVTQLFTEPYMVHFLIDNTLGAWWTARNPLVTPPVDFQYLRTLEDGTPAAGTFEGWPATLAEITMLDPCMGSGHFVVEVFQVMAALRMQDEGFSKAAACDAVLKENIHGLELDARCTQIAAFNLALTAWKFCGAYRVLPEMNLACSGIAPKGRKEDWVRLADAEADAAKRARLKGGLERMYDLFQLAPDLGSLIDPTSIQKDAFTSDFEELQPFLTDALSKEEAEGENHERGVIAAGIAKAGKLLAKRYVWQITNVPYLSRGKQDQALYNFCEKHYSKSKNDLATVFFEKMLKANTSGGTSCSVIPQNWLFLTTYKKFRKDLLKTCTWDVVARLGPKSFQTPMWDFNVMLLSISKQKASEAHAFVGVDVSEYGSAGEKDAGLLECELKMPVQAEQSENPDTRIVFDEMQSTTLLSKFADCFAGILNGDSPRFLRKVWEINEVNELWSLQQTTVSNHTDFDGLTQVIYYDEENGHLREHKWIRREKLHDSDQRGNKAWGKWGIGISQMNNLPVSLYTGGKFDSNLAVIYPKDQSLVLPLWVYCQSEEYYNNVRRIDQKTNVTNATLVKVPFDLERWQDIASKEYPNGLPKPHSNDPTQWIFHGHPKYTESPLQVSIARLLGYQWPAESDKEMELAEEARYKIKAIHDLQLPFDEDGIVCIPPVNGEPAAGERIREQVMKIWGEAFNGATLKTLIQQEGSTKKDLDTYLRDDFFTHHCKLFKNRPFIWHIWDGRKDGFAALVNYHKLDKATLEKLIYTYLGDWINQCQLQIQNNVSGADGLLSAANALKEKLQLILKGEPPYDLFIRWKPLEEQPIGWEPDINDGVRLNVYPFVQAGVLRKKFNVKWGKDRGKNPTGSPWGPDRYNRYEDLDEEWQLKDENKQLIPHLTNEVKRKAREEEKG